MVMDYMMPHEYHVDDGYNPNHFQPQPLPSDALIQPDPYLPDYEELKSDGMIPPTGGIS